jgi:hypothetical protein
MERLDTIRTERESRFWEQRMKNTEHHKNEMIKANLIKNETLIADPEIKEKIEKLKEEKEEKLKLKKMRNHNIGLDQNIDMADYQKVRPAKEEKENVKVSKKKKQKIARKQKLLNLNRNIAIPKKSKNKTDADEIDMEA